MRLWIPPTALLAASLVLLASGAKEDSFSEAVSAAGEIRLPDDFRGRYVHLGSWFVPEGDASGFHDVYAEPDAVASYRTNGAFPDGAVLVKELRADRSANYTTGAGVRHATDEIKQWFVMVKDTENRFAGDPRWGEGWGWALFKTSDPSKNAATDYQVDCLGCHVPAKSQDWLYTEAYPTLRTNAGSDESVAD